MRGTHHVIAGVSLLAIGSWIVEAGQHMRWSETQLPDFAVSIQPWMDSVRGTINEYVVQGCTWIEQLFTGGDATALGIALVGMPMFIVGTLLPDIDLPHSLLGRFMPWGIVWNRSARAVSVSPIAHRGWTHTVWALLAVVGLMVVSDPLWVWLLAGMVTHVLLDSMSTAGWVWYYPLLPSTWKIIERGSTRIVVSTRRRGVVGDAVRYSAQKEWLERVYVWVIVGTGVIMWCWKYYPFLLG